MRWKTVLTLGTLFLLVPGSFLLVFYRANKGSNCPPLQSTAAPLAHFNDKLLNLSFEYPRTFSVLNPVNNGGEGEVFYKTVIFENPTFRRANPWLVVYPPLTNAREATEISSTPVAWLNVHNRLTSKRGNLTIVKETYTSLPWVHSNDGQNWPDENNEFSEHLYVRYLIQDQERVVVIKGPTVFTSVEDYPLACQAEAAHSLIDIIAATIQI